MHHASEPPFPGRPRLAYREAVVNPRPQETRHG